MLPASHRMRSAAVFRETTRRGSRFPSGPFVIHAHFTDSDLPAQMGLTIGKAVGNSVVRHRTARRIRASFFVLLSSLPNGSQWVIRALPGAGECTTTTANIRTAVDRALVKAHGAS